jgi:prephenate dehydratase
MTRAEIAEPIVSIQGVIGSYHDKAARQYFGEVYHPLERNGFIDVFDDVTSGRAEFGLVAVQNSIYGPLEASQRLFEEYQEEITVVGETSLEIHHCLVGFSKAILGGITDVYSHYAALGQCTKFITDVLHGARTHEAPDTTTSVLLVKGRGLVHEAAIASADNAKRNGMKVLYEGIEDDPTNSTLFRVFKRKIA